MEIGVDAMENGAKQTLGQDEAGLEAGLEAGRIAARQRRDSGKVREDSRQASTPIHT